ncbi:hypothetical protein B7R77_07665 [Ralstonia solanacearum K60]|uniref:Uncharacterized protein n=1 Tax=Ralstonia solanacearum K60 TaxID=1091042 RepID=A0AAP7ZMM8_RALSL|nr:hypothetical protein [Ralstonia solanacearum]OYQ13139.1 hypothetical protein B7R77_07665 [Ralstonia solanacearum K60]
MSCATPILPSGPLGHVPEIVGHDPETVGHVAPKYAWVGNVGLGYLYCQPAGSTPYVPASQPDHETADHAHIEFSNFLSIEAIRHPTS